MAQSRRRRKDPSRSSDSALEPHADEVQGNVVIDAGSGRVTCEVPIEGSDGWFVSAVFLPQDRELVMAELKVFPGPREEGRRPHRRKPGDWSGRAEALEGLPDGGVSARLLRRIRLTDLQHLVAASMSGETAAAPPVSGLGVTAATPGTSGRSDRYYAEWAFAYAKKLAEGSRSPIKELAAEHGKTQSQVRDLIHDARVRGLLSKERQGRAAGSLTPRAIQLLKDGN